MTRNAAQQDAARLAPATPGQVNPGDQQLVQAVEKFSQPGELFNYRYQFKMDKSLKRPVVQVMDKNTGATLFEIPPEQVVQMLDALSKAGGGGIVDQKV